METLWTALTVLVYALAAYIALPIILMAVLLVLGVVAVIGAGLIAGIETFWRNR